MKKSGMSNLHYLLSALLILALTGCGASNHNLAGVQADGSIASKLVWSDGKSTSKKVGLATLPPGVVFTTMKLLVTGSDANGKAIPVVRSAPATVSNTVSIGGIYPGKVTLAVKAFTTTADVYEGYAVGVDVASGVTTNLDALNKTIVMRLSLEKAQDTGCYQCHETTLDRTGQSVVGEFKQSGHYTNSGPTASDKYVGVVGTGCAGCHGPQHNDPTPAASGRCNECHGAVLPASHKGNTTLIPAANNNCIDCHQPHDTKTFVAGRCVACHSVGQDATVAGNYVNDNNGVRAIKGEFAKWSHHVTGVTLNDAHCTACHLEGTVVDGEVVVDTTKHMVDAKTHLRNADTDADFAWNPSAPDHTGMDNFCMSCHDSNGAISATSVQIQAYINANGIAAPGKTASAKNPFGDTISNRYDKMQRPGVTDASSQFNTGNNSHHGVKGKRYSGRTRTAGPRAITNTTLAAGTPTPGAFDNNSSATLQGIRSTIYDAGNFNALYAPLGTDPTTTATTGLGDDSTLHCGDCHTVGQWKVGVATNAAGQLNTVAIGAHGSNNEYLLRNSIGSDQRHTQNAYTLDASNVVTQTNPNGAFLVCYNCHAYKAYGSTYVGTGANAGNVNGSEVFNVQSHAGEYDVQGRCNGAGNTNVFGTIAFGGYTTGKATDGTQFFAGTSTGANSRIYGVPGVNSAAAPYAGEQNTGFGNAFGIQCLNCHNSGIGNAYGGIHGSANNTTAAALAAINTTVPGGAYVDGTGHTTKVERFLPGLGNAMFVPGTLGGYTGNITNDTNWEQKYGSQTATTVINFKTGVVTNTLAAGAGCYTLDKSPSATAAVTTKLDKGPSVTGQGGPATQIIGTWGGCNDHNGAQNSGTAFLKRVVRPVTY